jgi:RNA polymerase sigma-70 factor (ECF subfamily)
MLDSLAMSLESMKQTTQAASARISGAETDNELVRLAKEGSQEAFAMLFERHRTQVYRFAYQMCPRRDDAEDIVQETFVRALKNLSRYRDEAKFTTWILRIATNYATDRARMRQRRTRLAQQEAGGALSWMTTGSDTLEAEENLLQSARIQVLRQAIEALPEHHKRMIIMRDIEEMEYADIAEICQTTTGGAKLRVLRARRALRDKLAPLMEQEAL